MTIRRTALIALAALLAAPQPAAAATLGQRIAAIVNHSRFAGAGAGYAVYDQTRARAVYLHGAGSQLKPASNMKLTTAVAALGRLGATARLETRVFTTGTRTGSTLNGNLWLVGGGDPSFSTGTYSATAFAGASGLVSDLAAAVRAEGITRVTGRIYGDDSRFDPVRVGPFWRWIYWMDCPPIAPLSVNEGWRSFGSTRSYRNQALHAAVIFRSALEAHGVHVAGGAAARARPAAATRLTGELSPPVYRLVLQMNQPSDNFYAEVLDKEIAVARGLGGTTANGRYVTIRYLASLGIGLHGARLADGSGLSLADRLSAGQLLTLLRRVGHQPYAWWFRNSLPLAGVSGTLRDRMRSGPAHRNARAKTGTLRDAAALSGYVTTLNGHRIAFSILINHAPYLNITAARALQDRIVQAIAGSRPR